jgi:PAS domain S-box-containing protein
MFGKRAEEAMKEGEGSLIKSGESRRDKEYLTLLKKAIESIDLGVTISDNEGKIIFTNQAEAEMHGYALEDLMGKEAKMFAPAKLWKHLSSEQMRDLVHYGRESINVRKDGSIFPVYLTSVPVRDEKGLPVGIVSICQDMTERKRAENEIRRSREQLRNLTKHLESVREEERKRISREIHDELGQELTALNMDISWLAGKLPEDQPLLNEKTRSMSSLVNRTIKTVQRISSELRPGILDALGLTAAIEYEINRVAGQLNISFDTRLMSDDKMLGSELSVALFRILQETLTNIARHAEATAVRVDLEERDGNIILKVHDNGKGITEEQVSDPDAFGMIGMSERAHLFGGNVAVTGEKDKGTTVLVNIPFNSGGR